MQPGARLCRREWMSRWRHVFACGGRAQAPEESWCRGSMASQSQSTCVALRSRVRSSSSCRCGSWRWQKKCSCKVCACFASASQPGGDGGLSKAEDSLSRGRVQPFGQRRQHHGDLLRGGFQSVQGRVASSAERGAAGLTAKGLDPLGTGHACHRRPAHECEHR